MSHADCESQKWQYCRILLFQCQGKYPSSQGGRGWRSSVSLSALIVQISTSLKASRKNVDLIKKITLSNVTERNVASVFTYNSLVGVISTTVCCSQSGGALLSVPWGQALLGGTADWDSVDAVCVTVTVTVIALAATITWCPNKDRAFPPTALRRTRKTVQYVALCKIMRLQTYCCCKSTVLKI